ncbi:cytochrome c biogenesis protein CcdA [Methylobacterium brachiatum]|uniref:cytochrome c biogenesis protein CcdA n=1 Tax=Methylobacterium brachiatum TaxID=269660 RepID=UPI001FDF3797|nr:cytochrome c biogenesis protein CcdA [Methylobacterium brachiatum]
MSLTVLGAVAGHLGALATEAFGRGWALTMAILSLCAALLAFWWPRMRLDDLTAWRRPGIFGAFAYGLVFSIGTSVAPLLLLLTVAASDGDPGRGVLLALVFGLGRGLPFLAAGMAGGAVTRLARLGLWGRTLQIVSGVALLMVSAYYAQVYADLL